MNVNKPKDLTNQVPTVPADNRLRTSRDVDNFVDNSEGFNHKRLKYN